jgi:hypothetical protein
MYQQVTLSSNFEVSISATPSLAKTCTREAGKELLFGSNAEVN